MPIHLQKESIMKKDREMVYMHGITKRFQAVLANDRIDFQCKKGEIHALLGENGAGKTTLMNILYGMVNPDDGEIFIGGEAAHITTPREALNLGIGMIHQHFMLIPTFSVLENVILGIPPGSGFFIDLETAREQVMQTAKNCNLNIEPDLIVRNLTVSSQQKVEILRLLYRGTKILILDEPTAVLAPQEIRDLFKILRGLASQGNTIIFITHKLEEVMEISDKVTVLRAGRVISTRRPQETTTQILAKEMVGRNLNEDLGVEGYPGKKKILVVKDLNAKDDHGNHVLKDIGFEVQEGEILGIAGVDGNGQRELAQVLTGLRKVESGQIVLDNYDLTNKTTRKFIEKGVAHVPEDRQKDGLILDFSIAENMVMQSHGTLPFSKNGFLHKVSIKKYADGLIKAYDIRPTDNRLPARKLSGGNQQKLILAREFSRNPKIIIACNPTRGLDVGSVEYIQTQLLSARKNGCAIILIDQDLDELFKLCDRLAVIYRGMFVSIVRTRKTDIDEIGLLMTGSHVNSKTDDLKLKTKIKRH